MRIRLVSCLSVLLFIVSGVANAVPPVAAGALASDNVDFVANIPDTAGVGGKVLGNILYLTTTQGLRIYDVSLGIPVPLGALELPNFENENVDTNGSILLISSDHSAGVIQSTIQMLYVIDVSNPRVPILDAVLPTPHWGHTITCVLSCQYAWNSGGDVIDLTDPKNPVVVGTDSALRAHNANVDSAGYAWVNGYGVYNTNGYVPRTQLRPPRVSAAQRSFGWHGSLRPDAIPAGGASFSDAVIDRGELVLGTDEDWLAAGNSLCADDGPFITSWFHNKAGAPAVDQLDTFTVGQGTVPNAKPTAVVSCSSHWFDHHNGVVADAWYEQGVRFLDVSNPRNIRQIGYYMPAVTEAWMSIFHPVTEGPLPGIYVYVFDYVRGLDVLRFTGAAGAATALAPRLNPVPVGFTVAPDPRWGWACRIVRA